MGQVNSIGPNETVLGNAGPVAKAPKPRDPKLWKAANDFQEVMLSQFTQSMRSTEKDNELFEECPGRETFDQMLSGAIAHQMSKSGAMGLNKMIYRAMGGAYEKSPAAQAQPPVSVRPAALNGAGPSTAAGRAQALVHDVRKTLRTLIQTTE